MENNIFARCGKIITNELYIPRIELEKKLKNRTIDGVKSANFGSISVVGMQRMGKSSLVYNTIVKNTESYYQQDVLIVSITMNLWSTPVQFFHAILDELYELIDDHDDVDERLHKKYQKAKESPLECGGVKAIQNFFRYLHKIDKSVICVIDEFDQSQKLFHDFPEGYNILRELSYQPETNVSFIFISRRMISELESNVDISTLANILGEPLFVKGYTKSELEAYFQRNLDYGFVMNKQGKRKLKRITGNQPYWLDLLLNNYYQLALDHRDMDSALDDCCGCLYKEFDQMMKLLEEQKLLDKLYQIVIGPAYDFNESDVTKLKDYGIIEFVEEGNGEVARMVSDQFYQYLQRKEQNVSFYPLWNKTERQLRTTLKQKMKEAYGEKWEQVLIDTYYQTDKKAYSIDRYVKDALKLQEKVRRQKDLYVVGCSYTLPDAMTTAGLFSLYLNEYHLFNDIFKMGKEEFFTIQDHLCKARNPYQHNNDDIIDPAFKKLTKDYCELINKKIAVYEHTNRMK